MKLRTEQETGRTLFIDVDNDKEVYALSESSSTPDDMKAIVREFELVGEVMTASVTDGGTGWASSLIGKLERRRDDLKTKLMDICK